MAVGIRVRRRRKFDTPPAGDCGNPVCGAVAQWPACDTIARGLCNSLQPLGSTTPRAVVGDTADGVGRSFLSQMYGIILEYECIMADKCDVNRN